ncbi:MAG: D-alanine--D-alanine ligase A [Chlamydiae bacterium GWF2_49_8]|nr:MAG: D-alanine--D-alanine ligase A [Chlamydiae bacterium GWF2_49_8]
MNKKIRLGILFGGKSVEHEVSLLSARNVVEALDRDRFEVVLIGIDKEGGWHLQDSERFLEHCEDPKRVRLFPEKERLAVVPKDKKKQLVALSGKSCTAPLDVIFPLLHGPYGEDGTVQGLLKLAGIPFVGAGVLSSAVCMDKDVMKRLFLQGGLPTARFFAFKRSAFSSLDFERLAKEIGLPFFLKPANTGSSVGISKVKRLKDFAPALEEAAQYDDKILIEEFLDAREIECSVLGNEEPIASCPGEVIPTHEFYSYEAKYLDEKGAHYRIPAELDEKTTKEVQSLSVKAFQVCECEGMARVDFFLRKSDGKLFLNEINTIPGFTSISMYPKLWQASGLCYKELLERLINLQSLESRKKANLR